MLLLDIVQFSVCVCYRCFGLIWGLCSEKFLQIDYPHLGTLCNLVIPCALTALDHWSPEVKVRILIFLLPYLILVNSVESPTFSCWKWNLVDSDLRCMNKKLVS